MYFYGEFSKQFSIKEPLYNLIFFAILPGIVLQLVGYLLYAFMYKGLPISDCMKGIQTLFSSEVDNNGSFGILSHLEFSEVLIYQLFICVFSFTSGFLSARLIRYLNLDKHSKILRFRNQWYYILSGEILVFKKFKPHFVHINPEDEKSKKQFLTYVDVVLEAPTGYEMYSGFVIDYELKNSDPSELDKLYLKGASRYVVTPENGANKSRGEKLEIPGDVFVLETDKLLNMNVSYKSIENAQVPTPWLYNLTDALLGLLFLTLWLELIFNFDFIISKIIGYWGIKVYELGWWAKTSLVFGLSELIGSLQSFAKKRILRLFIGLFFIAIFIILVYYFN